MADLEGITATASTSRGRITYREWGRGQPVLCIPGTLMDGSMFSPQGEYLADRYRLIALDSRGRSDDRWRGPYTLDDLALDALALVDRLGVGAFSIVGMSLGGMVAPMIALRAPDRVDALVFLNSVTEHHPSPNAAVWESLNRPDPLGEFAYELGRQVFGPTARADRPELVSSWTDRWAVDPAEKVYWEVQATMARPDIEARYAEIDLPALIVHSEHERFWGIDYARRLEARLPRSSFLYLPDAGHTSQLERPDIVNPVLGAFLDTVYGPAR